MASLKTFKYVATDSSNRQLTGTYKAKSRDDVAAYLRNRNYLIVSINEDFGANLQKLLDFQVGGVSLKDRMIITKQLSTMLAAGLPVLQSIEILGKQVDSKNLQEELQLVKEAIEGGSTLSVAFRKNSKLFNEIQLNLLAAGEKSGNMVEVIADIAVDMEKSHSLRTKIRSAMIYPIIIFITIIGVMIMLVVFMVPTVESLYADFNASDKIPGVTLFLIAISDFFTNWIGLVSMLGVIIVGVVSFKSFQNTENGKMTLGGLMLKVPVFGALTEKIHLAEFGRLLSMLLRSGVSILDALEIVSKSLPNPLFSKHTKDAIDEVSKGAPLAVPLAKSGIFPLIYVRMVSTGEQTGNLDQILADVGKFYEDEVNEITENLTKLMEPIILLVVGGMVGFLAIAVYLPIYNIGTVIS